MDETEKRLNQKLLIALFTPSWLSGLLAVTTGLVVTVGVIVLFSLHNSQVQQQLVGLQNTAQQSALTLPGEAPPNAGTNSLQNTWPLLAFWSVIGFIVYFVIETIVKALSNFAELQDELHYVHAKRDVLLKTTIEYLLLRIVAAVVWLVFIDIFFKRIIPYSITAAYASASSPLSFNSFLYALISFVMIALSMHAHAIFLRLALRRPRVFSSSEYV
jgi:hypothetical protein